jgi:hypothetical protein
MPKARRTGKSKTQGQPPSSTAATPVKPLYQRREMSPRGRVISLVSGDILCFLIFVSLGADQHGEGFDLLYNLWLALPFVAAWLIVSPFVGAFRADVATQPTKMIIRTLLSWLATWPVAMAFRWLLVDRVKQPPTSFNSFLAFAFVTLAFNIGLLLLWRWPFALNNDLRKRGI